MSPLTPLEMEVCLIHTVLAFKEAKWIVLVVSAIIVLVTVVVVASARTALVKVSV